MYIEEFVEAETSGKTDAQLIELAEKLLVDADKKVPQKRCFTITVEETLCQDFNIEATTAEEACEIARKMYREGKIEVENGEVQSANALYLSPDLLATQKMVKVAIV